MFEVWVSQTFCFVCPSLQNHVPFFGNLTNQLYLTFILETVIRTGRFLRLRHLISERDKSPLGARRK